MGWLYLNWDNYRNTYKMNKYDRNFYIKNNQTYLSNIGMDTPACKEVYINGSESPSYMIIHSTQRLNEKTFNMLPEYKIKVGDTVVFNNTKWLVVEWDVDNDISDKGRMMHCNKTIRWQNPITKEIISRLCVVEKPYYSNLSEGKVVTVSTREYKISVPIDDETIKVDIDKRFLFEKIDGNPKAYKLTSTDISSEYYEDLDGGYAIWNISQDEYNEYTDNAELMIADYINPDETLGSTNLGQCKIFGSDYIKVGGSYRDYSVVFYKDDSEDSSVNAVISVDTPEGYDSYFKLEYGKNSVKISCMDNDNLIGKTISISAQDENGLYEPNTFSIRLVGLYG